MTVGTEGRVVHDVVDGAGLWFARAASAEGFVFLGSPAADETGAIAAPARVEAPYVLSRSAHARAQGRFLLDRYQAALSAVGASLADVCQTEDYFPSKKYVDGYLEAGRAPDLLGEDDRPDAMSAQVDALVPADAVVLPLGIAVVPGVHGPKETVRSDAPFFEHPPGAGAHWPGAPLPSEIVAAGPYVFATVAGHDYGHGPHRDAKTVEWYWHGHEMRSEAQYVAIQLQAKLAAVGASLSDVVHCKILLPDAADLYELDRVWGELWPSDPPARSVVPVTSLGYPRADGARGHRQRATRMEIQVRAIRPDRGAERETIGTGAQALGVQAEAIRAGGLLWTSGLLAGGPQGPVTQPDALSQLRLIFDWIAELAEAAGSDVANLLRLNVTLTDGADAPAVFAALRERVPSDPPSVGVTVAPGPLAVPGCSVLAEAVVHAP